MVKKLGFFRVKTANFNQLGDLDEIYANAVCQLPNTTRREYCQRLIKRIKLDLKTVSRRKKKRQLRQIIKSATSEISKLEPKTKT